MCLTSGWNGGFTGALRKRRGSGSKQVLKWPAIMQTGSGRGNVFVFFDNDQKVQLQSDLGTVGMYGLARHPFS